MDAVVNTRRRARARAFTLVELLVVIGIIALLISILLPSLNKARRAANTVKCAANLRSIMQGVQIYAALNKGYFPGSTTSGRHLFKESIKGLTGTAANNPTFSEANCPSISQNWDWQAPVAKAMGVQFEEGETQDQRVARFEYLRSYPTFVCPENTIIATPATFGPPVKADLVPSYALATQFHLLPVGSGGSAGRTQGSADLTSPQGYSPQMAKIKNAAEKIFIADGARFSNAGVAPNVAITYISSGGGAYGDLGPWAQSNNCWDRSRAPGNTPRGNFDARVYAYRHGRMTPDGPADTYRFNAAFFDGHVASMGDLEGANPNLWMPSGSWYDPGGGFPMSNDTASKYGGNSGGRAIP